MLRGSGLGSSGAGSFRMSQMLSCRSACCEKPVVTSFQHSSVADVDPSHSTFVALAPSWTLHSETTQLARGSIMRIFLSLHVNANNEPFWFHLKDITWSATGQLKTSSCSARFHVLTVRSKEVEATMSPAEGLKVQNDTFFPWPSKVARGSRMCCLMPSSGIAHTFIVMSSLALRSMLSSKGLNSKSRIAPEWPVTSGRSRGSRPNLWFGTTAKVPPPPESHGKTKNFELPLMPVDSVAFVESRRSSYFSFRGSPNTCRNFESRTTFMGPGWTPAW
mmetsp:Transcript_4429/g.12984  ORF Transcript_4429/g.12984 Transcript_4429/m.12984 type:complete len:276 (-) Transcript_4429:39-866(-)